MNLKEFDQAVTKYLNQFAKSTPTRTQVLKEFREYTFGDEINKAARYAKYIQLKEDIAVLEKEFEENSRECTIGGQTYKTVPEPITNKCTGCIADTDTRLCEALRAQPYYRCCNSIWIKND